MKKQNWSLNKYAWLLTPISFPFTLLYNESFIFLYKKVHDVIVVHVFSAFSG